MMQLKLVFIRSIKRRARVVLPIPLRPTREMRGRRSLTAHGDLYYNANGGLCGFGGGGKIATLEGAPKIRPSDFVLE